MRSAEVADLICQNAGNLCVQFERAADGQVKTLDYQARRTRGWSRYHWIVVGVLAAIGATVGRAAWQEQQSRNMVRGQMLIVPAPTPAPLMNAPATTVCPTE